MTRTGSRWYSQRVEQEISLVRWGHWGQPVLVFPTAGGDAEEIERMQMIGALAPLIDAGRIKVYSCDNLAGRAFADRAGSVEYRCALLDRFEDCIAREVVPAIRTDCNSGDIEVLAAGASLGAFMAVAVTCRYPWLFRAAVGMSGNLRPRGPVRLRRQRGLLLLGPAQLPAEPRRGRRARHPAPAFHRPRLRPGQVGESRRVPGGSPACSGPRACRTGSIPGARSTTTTGRHGGRCCRSTSTT